MIARVLKKIPKLPLSALVFYLAMLILWKVGAIPSPREILLTLESLYNHYGLMGLFMASFLEGIVYMGMYFPGSFIVALAVILSDGRFISLISISIVVAIALTITSIINFQIGRKVTPSKSNKDLIKKEKKVLSKGLFASMLHPNALAFYFFNSGIKNQDFKKVLLVPIIMIPYGLLLGYLFYSIKGVLKSALEKPYVMITILLIWVLIGAASQIKNQDL
jgi:membrane protein YqaA with SNARE-associated domain